MVLSGSEALFLVAHLDGLVYAGQLYKMLSFRYTILLVDEILHHFTCTLRLTLVLPLQHWGSFWLLQKKEVE